MYITDRWGGKHCGCCSAQEDGYGAGVGYHEQDVHTPQRKESTVFLSLYMSTGVWNRLD